MSRGLARLLPGDAVSDGKDNRPQTQTVPFRTVRLGLENDQAMHELLDQETRRWWRQRRLPLHL